MIHIDQVKLGVESMIEHVPEGLLKRGVIGKEEEYLVRKATALKLKISEQDMKDFSIRKKSLDARKKDEIFYIYQVEFSGKNEKRLLERYRKKDARIVERKKPFKERTTILQEKRMSPVVVGFGPAGMFAALTLARKGYSPVVIERGMSIEKRRECVESFWDGGTLDPESNVQFGEGGAGTFSDGKLNTMVKDRMGTNRRVLETFVEFGAPSEILYLQKPHIGTDRLREVVRNIREEVLHLGGRIFFDTKLIDIRSRDGRLTGIAVEREGNREEWDCTSLILAVGHSARDTFYMLRDRNVLMEPKAFAMGVRIEHPQELIGENQYGRYYPALPAADYKLTYQTRDHRGVYSFCMCPGGYVVNSSSETDGLVVNGMSDYLRDGKNANSAIVVTVSPEDFGSKDALAGVEFQRKYERAAYLEASGKIPVQLLSDFLRGEKSSSFGKLLPQMKGKYAFGNLRQALPEVVSQSIAEGIPAFGKKISGFDREDAVLSGIESRTSSPVRILRNDGLVSNISGFYPCGEGAGYAGGITSAAMDGIRVAEKLAEI